MIKEKSEKGPDGVKEEPGSSDKESTGTDVHVKKEDDPTGSSCGVKKEPGRPITKNGGIIGSTNTGSLHNERKTEEETSSGTDNPNIPLKTEECIPPISGDAFGLNIASSAPAPLPAPPDGVQPLASNVINKSSNMEVQYMQQQSQIFVFSTTLANSGAEEVLQRRYPSIIAYHCAQPGTKKYLEKNPFKATQFNRQNPAQWLNNLAMMKNKGCTRSPGLGPKTQSSLDNFLGTDSLEDMVALTENELSWEQKNNHHLENLEGVGNGLPDVPDMDSCSPSLANVQPSLQGVKVPDENLTPQQRQHREVQLATIRKIHQILFPEDQNMEGTPANEVLDMQPPNDWQKLQNQFFDNQKPPATSQPSKPTQIPPPNTSNPSSLPHREVMRGGGPSTTTGPRLQGPPPPYHQTPRSASVPIALQSPSPASPNNPTSNLSLPSPRASSGLNSPADPSRPFGLPNRHMSPTSQDSPQPPRLNHSNPGTPVSSHVSPTVTCSTSEPTTSSHQQNTDGIFGRTLQSIAQQKQMLTSSSHPPSQPGPAVSKEPNLMPVPSPQQIQYLNTFEGQELIIQKQPNTSLKEGNMISPPRVLPTTMDSGFNNTPDLPHTRGSCPNTPTSMDVGPRFPSTPGVTSEGCRFQIPSPHTPTTPSGDKTPRLSGPGPGSAPGLSPQTVPGPTSDPLKSDLFPTPSPHMMDANRFPGPSASPGSKMGTFNVPPHEMPGYGCVRGENVPLNPNCTSAMPGNPKVSHFDPISSLAQMSQQLTNSVPSSLNGQGGQGPGMMNFGSPSMHMMDLGNCHGMNEMDQPPAGMMGMPMQGPPHAHGFHSPSPMGPIRSLSPKLTGAFPNHMTMPRMIGRPPGPNPYNGANVQVKPSAPNTIQYLPAKPQVGNAPGPRGPPSLDFLQRFTAPIPNMDNKMPTQNMQYFPNCPANGPMQGGPMGAPHMSHMEGPMGDGPMGPGPMMGGPLGNGAGPMMGGGMGMPGMMPMMRMRPPPNMMRMPPQMGFNGPAGGAPDGMFNPGQPNPQMFVSGPKGSPMGMAPDASQPLPPSMGQNNSFKNSAFVGPTTADPNYAQQYHNFQQQLYATTTRSQMGGQTMGHGT
nr:protein BCL9 homolog isoform X1 [Onthophagus taurus]